MVKQRFCFIMLFCILISVLFFSCGVGKNLPEETTVDAVDTDTVETTELPLQTEEFIYDTTSKVIFTKPDETEAAPEETQPVETVPKETVPKVTETQAPVPDDTEDTDNIWQEPEVVLCVADAPEDVYTEPQKYEVCLHSDSEYARDVLITPTASVNGFKFFTYDLTKYMNENICEIQEILYTVNELTPQKPFAARILIPEFISSYGVSYEDNSGITHIFMFCESGLDGSVLLVPLE